MAKIKIIASIGKNNELGINNTLIWRIKEDLNFFKEQTSYHKIVMGYNTYMSLPKLLVNRTHIVLTHHEIDNDDVITFSDMNSLMNYLNLLDEVVYVIGGAKIYELFISLADEIVLTEIDDEKQADVYFPRFNKDKYIKEVLFESESNNIKFKHVIYKKI